MLDITGMLAESLEALNSNQSRISSASSSTTTTPTNPTFTINYDSSPSNYGLYEFYDYSSPTLNYDLDDRYSSTNTLSTLSSSTIDFVPTFDPNSRPPPPLLLPLETIDKDDIAFERLINLDDNIQVSYGKSNFDVIINIGEEPNIKKFRTHSVILSKRSSYFRTALSSRWAKKQERLDVSTLFDVLVASDELILEDFTDEIQKHIMHLESNLLKPNLIQRIITCYNNQSFNKLLRYLLKLIKIDPSFLISQNDIYLLQENILEFIMEESREQLDDWMKWNFIIKWGIGQQQNLVLADIDNWSKSDFEKLNKTIHSLLRFIRFSHIPRNYIVDQILPFISYFKEIDNETKPQYKFNLLYRMTQDDPLTYHEKCLKQEPTFVIVKARSPIEEGGGGPILIGGYNPVGFNNNYVNIDSPLSKQAFIFSFGDGKALEKARVSRVKTDWSRMVIDFSSISPSFGFDNLIVNFNDMKGTLLKSDILEYEIFQVLEP
ncbi:2576_t:CDS:2 [Diversispora eburnea]|uniref:2576_t:CDS:1 n=1 Tax=Diversispora eburnea TaxID=1213867 RepID=A0A9N8WAG6_9GLOM|nr:2576_t:CDS:2 [Diversispora eburnea]